ncbi:damage-inducible protein CinA [Alsobacter soli]|uniref:Damage-inducible protein CinA n=1 Tax=Alsobacter soli TaxID=2109933 RepID=A0A2T1HXC5_9HYPH|nr:CinA family protein [Alsobacter soli]PSC06353.1 damage-inducible protein CinA [Alsobacter soli]
MIPHDIENRAAAVLAHLRTRGMKAATVESCTGGLVSGALTAVPGSSDVVERGFVTYSNEAKVELVGVPPDVIRAHGAVSEPVARAMAEGALAHSPADVSVAITGVAGPGGGSDLKPVGLVHFAAARRGGTTIHLERRYGDLGRAGIREAAVRDALDLLERVSA